MVLDLFLVTVARYFPSRVLMTFYQSVLHTAVSTHLNSAIRTVFLLDEASARCGSVFSDLALCLAVGGHASDMSGGAFLLSHSRFSSTSGTDSSSLLVVDWVC